MSIRPNIPRTPTVSNHPFTAGLSGILADTGRSDEQLFEQLWREVLEQRLYLNPQLSRADLMRLIRVPKNRISRVIARGAGTNLAGFINSFRIKHAGQLLVEHANYAVEAVACDVGLPNVSTFYRLFKARYGVTPALYRERHIGS